MAERESVSRVQKKDNLSLANQFDKGKTSGGSHPLTTIQKARLAPQSLTPADIMQLQKTMGNQAVCQLMAEAGLTHKDSGLLQEMDAMSSSLSLQRVELPEEEEEPMQMKRENKTGLPDALKSGVENLSGIDMSDVRVHYSSDKPAQIGALAYTQGTEIHVAPGQEKHLPHEAWHVVQQAQGRVRPTMQLHGMNINDNEGLEQEATRMGDQSIRNKEVLPKENSNHMVDATISKEFVNQMMKIDSDAAINYTKTGGKHKDETDVANGSGSSGNGQDSKAQAALAAHPQLTSMKTNYKREQYPDGTIAADIYTCAEPKALARAAELLKSENKYANAPNITSITVNSVLKEAEPDEIDKMHSGGYYDAGIKVDDNIRRCPTCVDLLGDKTDGSVTTLPPAVDKQKWN